LLNLDGLFIALLKIGVKKIGTQGDQKAAQQTPDKSLLRSRRLSAFVLALSARNADF